MIRSFEVLFSWLREAFVSAIISIEKFPVGVAGSPLFCRKAVIGIPAQVMPVFSLPMESPNFPMGVENGACRESPIRLLESTFPAISFVMLGAGTGIAAGDLS
jgi:hypothetical protein